MQNYAAESYFVVLDFHLSNTTYQDNYVTFNNETYTVIPGQQNLVAWLEVETYPPPVDTSLAIEFKRLPGSPTSPFLTEQLQIIQVVFWGTQSHINISVRNTGTATVVITEILVNNITEWTEEITILPSYEKTATVNVNWVSGEKCEIRVLSSTDKQFLYTAVAP